MYLCHLQYFVLVVLIFIMEIVAGVLAFVYRRDIETFLSKELVAGIRQHYPSESEPDPEGLRAAWGFIQTEVRLCALLTNHPPFPQIDIIGDVVIVWRVRGKSGDCLEGKGENYQVCSVQYCVQQLCTVRCTHI